MIAAHGNSLRAIIMYLDKLTPKEVIELELSTGIPMLYTLKDAEFLRRGSPVGPTVQGVYALTQVRACPCIMNLILLITHLLFLWKMIMSLTFFCYCRSWLVTVTNLTHSMAPSTRAKGQGCYVPHHTAIAAPTSTGRILRTVASPFNHSLTLLLAL